MSGGGRLIAHTNKRAAIALRHVPHHTRQNGIGADWRQRGNPKVDDFEPSDVDTRNSVSRSPAPLAETFSIAAGIMPSPVNTSQRR